MLVSRDLAAEIESGFKQTHIEVISLYDDGQILPVSGGAACYSGSNSYLSQVVAWGFTTEPNKYLSEISAIEQFYKSLNYHRVDIEVCPYMGQELAEFLSRRGYQITELNNVYYLDLSVYQWVDVSFSPLVIKQLDSSGLTNWAQRVALGFGYPEAESEFAHYVEAKGVHAFGIYDQELIVAGGVISKQGKVGDLGLTCTFPDYRNMQLHQKLLFARLNFAKEQGLRLATVTTTPGSISDLNVQKVGFQSAYTRIKMTLFL